MIRAVYFDADGTLVSFRTHAVPQETIAALKRLHTAGVKCILCTGRNAGTSAPLLDTGLFDGAILLNGQLCTLNGEAVLRRAIDKSDLEIAVDGAERGDFTLGFVSGYENFMNRFNAQVWLSDEFGGMPPMRLRPAREALEMEIYQMHIYGSPGCEDALVQRAKGLVAARWSENFADVFPLGGGKEIGMRAINEHLGIAPEQTMAFGDGENDVGMLKYAGVGVAMGNASDAVKAQANYVAPSVDDGGIAHTVELFAAQLGL